MPRNPAVIVISTENGVAMSAHKAVSGRPDILAPFINAALSGHRRLCRDPHHFIALIVSSGGLEKAAAYRIFPSTHAIDEDHEYRYEIEIIERGWKIRVTQLTDEGPMILYNDRLEAFLTKAMRNAISRAPGRIPRGYSNRAEYEANREARAANKQYEEIPVSNSTLREDILKDRAADPDGYVEPNLEGIRVLTPEERRKRFGYRAPRRKNRLLP